MNKNLIRRICVVIGICLLVAAVGALAFWSWNIVHSEKQAERYVDTLQELLPEIRDAVLEERSNNTMSVLSVDGTDFMGILEMPSYGITLPVGADWGRISQYPCRFGGSIYDGTMQIGATTQKGQFDCYRQLSVGDTLIYTDMEGNRYAFEITVLRNAQHADQAALQREEAPLTLFIKNMYSFEYLIIFCDVQH